jgi:murein DD-endopeptidase MepM/ murein hydrolase activator NlpD
MKKLLQALLVVLGIRIFQRYTSSEQKYESQNVYDSKRKKCTYSSTQTPIHFMSHPIKKYSHWGGDFREKPISFVVITLLVLSFLVTPLVSKYSHLFRASLIELKTVKFTGTIAPIQKVPNWVDLTELERKMTYQQLPKSKFISLPEYDLDTIQRGRRYTKGHKFERNTYITYPVPNLGNYKLDGTENSGSHTGIDIKVPIGTPIHAIANGVVYKVGDQATGFGKHIVVAHVGIPDPENKNKKTTLFSSYAHMSFISVREGDEVKKGQIIGKSGDTGMATAPHLHFQIDKSDAPFFPYWPFSWNDVQKAGLSSYFEAVKRGIGKSNGLKYTVHPMNLVSSYENYSEHNHLIASGSLETVIVSEPIDVSFDVPVSPTIPLNKTSKQLKKQRNNPSSNNTTRTNISIKTVEFKTDRIYIPGQEKTVQVLINKDMLVASDGIEIDSTLRHMATVKPKVITSDMIIDGVTEVSVKTSSDKTFKLIATGNFGEVKSKSLRAQVFTDVPVTNRYANSIKYLREKEIITGYPDGSFKPNGTLNRAEAVKILLEGNDISVGTELPNFFLDVPNTAWYAHYVGTAVKKGIVKGYANGNFKPANTISRAEFLKVALLTAGFEVKSEITHNPYEDVPRDQWFAPYFDFAKTNNLLFPQRGGYMVPSQPITRAEAADVIYKISRLK